MSGHPDDVPSEPGERALVDRRRFLGLALGAAAGVAAHACSTETTSAPAPTGSTSTTAPTSTSTSTSSVAPIPTTPRLDAGLPVQTGTIETGTIDGGARVGQPAERLERPRVPGAYDREALHVALYGFPGSSVLGALGEQDVDGAMRRVVEVASGYEGFGRRVAPTFEILGSVASASAGADGDYSNEFDPERFRPWLDAAAANDIHVVFDLQPGRSRFPDQAREYEALWRSPHVSIALDPEWRVGPTERPGGGRIGSVGGAEVNETVDYIDEVIRRYELPPKLCIVHQFADSMVTDKQIIRGTENVQVLFQMDGFGSLTLKRGSWSRMVDDLPVGALTGWKNFYDEDRPTPTPAETMANDPQPSYVSYQ